MLMKKRTNTRHKKIQNIGFFSKPRISGLVIWIAFASKGYCGNIDVIFDFDTNVPMFARAAAQNAASHWEGWLLTPQAGTQTFDFKFHWKERDPINLASAGALWRGEFEDLAYQSTLYLSLGLDRPLLEQFSADAQVTVNSLYELDFSSGVKNLDSILIHELGHTFGFDGGISTFLGSSTWGVSVSNILSPGTYLTPYAARLTDINGNAPVVGSANVSPTGGLFFSGPEVTSISPNGVLPVYSPEAYIEGSSVSHTGFYSVMWPEGNPFEGLHAFEVAMLEDIGWLINKPSTLTLNSVVEIVIDTPLFSTVLPASWHQGDQWGGLPPSEITNVTLGAGVSSYTLEVYEGKAEAQNLTLDGSADSVPTIHLTSFMAIEGSLSVAMSPGSTGTFLIDGGSAWIGGDMLVGGGTGSVGRVELDGGSLIVAGNVNVSSGGDLNSNGLISSTSLVQTGGNVLLAEGAQMQTSRLEINEGQFDVHSGASLGPRSFEEGLEISIDGGVLNFDGAGGGSHFEMGNGVLNLRGDLGFRSGDLVAGEIRIHNTDSSLSIGSADSPATWSNTSIIGAGRVDSYLSINSSNLTIVDGEHVVENVALDLNGITSMEAGNLRVIDSEFRSNGVLTLKGGCVILSGIGSVEANGSVLVSGDACVSSGGGGAFRIEGELVKSGSGTNIFSTRTTVNGAIRVTEGVLRITGSGEVTGSITVDSGALFEMTTGFNARYFYGSGVARYIGGFQNDAPFLVGDGMTVETPFFMQSEAGILSGSGTLRADATLGGTISPGMSPGVITIEGNVSFIEQSVLRFEFGAPGGNNDLLRVVDPDGSEGVARGDVVLDGILDVTALAGFGEGIYPIIAYDGIIDYRGVQIRNLPSGFSGSLEFSVGLVGLRVARVATSGSSDQDADGVPDIVEEFMGTTGNDFTPNPGVAEDGTVTWPKSPTFSGRFAVQTSSDLITWKDVTDDAAQVTINVNSVVWMPPNEKENIFVRLSVNPN